MTKSEIKYNETPNKCPNCETVIPYSKRYNKFCSSSCSASYNNKLREKKTKDCLHCGKQISNNKTYCDNKCQKEYEYMVKVSKWKQGEIDSLGVSIRRYLTENIGYKCSKCSISEWNGSPITLEVEHIDGNSSNNKEENLTFLCPNCHSQTDTYKGKNKGSGRHIRRERYKKGKSY